MTDRQASVEVAETNYLTRGIRPANRAGWLAGNLEMGMHPGAVVPGDVAD